MATTQETREPKTEEEANEREEFLKSGAATSVERVARFPARDSATAALGQPATVTFNVSAAKLTAEVGDDAQRRVTLAFDVVDLARGDAFYGHLFVNSPDANEKTPATEPAFAGGFAFFCHEEREMEAKEGILFCPVPGGQPLRYEQNVTPALRKPENPDTELTVTVVLVPFSDRRPQARTMTLDNIELNIVQSTVKQ
ncbi:MAG TPA: hypothetical protein VFA34_00245 [Actinomycetota bacterium]|jgi:hypothetical protein|nr:hypothetical protein [Actinomycetota bacterium]